MVNGNTWNQRAVAQSAGVGAIEYTALLQRGKTHTPNECPGYDT